MSFPPVFKLSTHRLRLMLPGFAAIALCFTLLLGMQPAKVSAHTALQPSAPQLIATGVAPFQVPPLTYSYDALAPYIDAETMHLHHDKHHQASVTALNAAIEKYPQLRNQTAQELILKLNQIPDEIRTVIRNNAGSHLNHSLFWQSMAPNQGGVPTGEIATAINQSFGSFDAFKQKFNEAGTKRFGSGWVWLVLDQNRDSLQVMDTPNQDNPLMQGYYPLLGNDVWEHAYYLTYKNRRADYLNAWWSVVNWDNVNQRYMQAKRSR
jgi:Fe-Mn family superoxide dismutase